MIDTSTLASANISLFLTKTYEFVDDPSYDRIVAWKDDGRGFVVKDVYKFCDQILQKYFKHNNFSSFTRQLNYYSFKTLNVHNEKAFYHESFQRGNKMLLANIQRKKKASEKLVAEANVLKAKLNAMEHNH